MSDSNRPEPVLDEASIAGKITGALTALLTLGVAIGFLKSDDTSGVVDSASIVIGAVISFVNLLVPKWRAWRARSKVTPLASPMTAAGEALVVARR